MKKLEEYRKEPGFTSPEGYYDDLYNKMMERVTSENIKTNNHKKILWFSIMGTAAAAAIAVFVTFTFLHQNNQTDTFAEAKTSILHVDQESIEESPIMVADLSQITEIEFKAKPIQSVDQRSKAKNKSSSYLSNTETSIVGEDPLYSVLEFYEDDLLSDQFQEALMDLECYYEF